LVEKLDLAPPVDIKSLLLKRAQVEYVDWSHECDAVTVLGEDPPRVFVRSDLPALRERFTLAHELGHIELAWHVGTVDCQLDSTAIEDEFSVKGVGSSQEREANEFASRVLAPDRWLAPLVNNVSNFERTAMKAILSDLAVAEMSALAGAIALSRHLLPGHALFIGDAFAISRGTSWPGNPPIGLREIESYLENAVTVEEFSHQGRSVLWGVMIPQSILPADIQEKVSDSRTPHKVLIDACIRVFGESAANSKAMSINGVVGGMTSNSDLGWHAEAIAAVVHDRIQQRSDLRAVIDDPEFYVYLHKKAYSIIAKRANAVD
jgi:hypothetical protein